MDKPGLLLVDDDETFLSVLSRAMEKRGFSVQCATCVENALFLVQENPPEYAVVDLKMPGDSGLVLIKKLKEIDEATRIVVLTGYASIATAVEAVKLGAIHYLTKPAKADEIAAALQRDGEGDVSASVNTNPMSVDRLEWEHIQSILAEHDGNISATARSLNMHRRTLQRKLAKKPAKN
ncbi:MAG: response regulator transcription factor [Burkholderiales bacterium]